MPQIEVRRSSRRRRTSQARLEGDKVIVMVPASLSAAEEDKVVRELVDKLEARRARSRSLASDEALMARATTLSARYLDGAATPTSVRWVTNQNTRWGSCSALAGSIRLSHRVQTMPDYVIDHVLLHELAHLIESNHGPRFYALVTPYPHYERAEGFLAGAEWKR